MNKKFFSVLAGSVFLNAVAGELPVVQDVDVVVAGGSSAAVAAAVAAKQAGATVFLAAPRPYLGEDLAGTLHLARVPGDDESHPIYRAIFDGRRAARAGWPFTYAYDATPDKLHADAKKTVLSDGVFGNAAQNSVQFPSDVTVSVDLGAVRDVAYVELSTYLREQAGGTLRTANLASVGYRTAAMEVSASRDGKAWSPLAFSDKPAVRGTTSNGILTVPIEGQWRYLRVRAIRDAAYSRQLLGELRIAKGDSAVDALVDRATPFAVKRALDEALLAAKVPYLTGAVPCALLKDADGRACGIVIADRSGRQAIRAKTVIDATPRGRIARLAGARSLRLDVPNPPQFVTGPRTFSRVVLSGERPTNPRLRVTQLPDTVPITVTGIRSKEFPNAFDAHFWKCEMDVDMPDGSARSFAAAEQALRDATFTPLQADAANTAVLADEPALWVRAPVFALAPCDFPGKAITAGAQAGAAAAKAAKGTAAPRGPVSACAALPGEKVLKLKPGERVGEHAKALPAYLVKASGTVADDASLPLLATCDTFVAGAGTGGGPAGISAARAGAKTIVCDYLYMMGGVSTDGLIGLYYFGNRVGFTHEIDEGVKAMGAVFPQCKSEWYRREQRRAGAEIWFGTMVQGVIVDGTRVTGVVVVMPDGTRGAVRCANVVDSTGNAEIPALAGTDTEFITDTELSVQGAGIARNTLGTGYANSDLSFVDDTDAADLFYFALRSRASLPADTWDQAQVVNSRERRRMVGAFYMTPPDVMNERTYPDTVVRTYSNFDSHGQTAHDAFFIEDPGHKPMYVNLPYRCLLPKTLDGVLVTGLGISAHRDAMPILRMEPDVQNQGYAAGFAAASAVKAGVSVRNVDVKALQAHLVEKKVIDADVPKQQDSFPLSDEAFAQAVRDIADGYKGLGVLMTDPDRARPLLAGAYATAEGAAKFNYAHLLAMLGRDDGAALVLAKFKAMDWDLGWNYRGMGQFNRSVSWVDSYAIALGHAKVRAAVPALIEKADKLTEKSEYSHFRAIARALEEIGDKSAAPALARVLKRPGIAGHAQRMESEVPVFAGYSNKAGDWERTLSLREICIARALYRLGDTPDGLGRRTLEAYAADPRRAFATHARLVLGLSNARSVCDEPTGCPDFTVELPREKDRAVVRAVDFGLSEANDHNALAINAALAEARRVRASRVELAPGTYRCFDGPGVQIDGLEDFTFDGKGATLVFRRDHAPLATQAELLENEGNVEVKNCVRTVVENFNIDWDWETDPLAVWCTCAGKHVDEADNASYIDFDLEKPHPKYPNQVPVQLLTPMAADKSGARMTGNQGVRGYFGMSLGHIGAKSEWVSPTRLRVWPYVRPAKGYVTDESLNRYKAKSNRSLVKGIDIGGTYTISHCYYGLNGFVLTSNRHFTLRNVDIWACRGLGVETRGAQKWWQLVNVNIRPKPGCRYPVTSTADAHHVVQSQGFGKMVGCEVSMHQDDHFNYHDRTQIAQTRGPRTVEVVNNRGVAYTLFRVGTLIALRHEDFSEAGWTGRIVEIDGEHITFDRDLPPQKGMLFVLLDKGYATENFLFKDCWFHDAPWSRGIVQGNNVTLDGCRFGPMIGTPLKFISCYTYTCWCEGIGCSNVVVRNCRFENCLSSRYENMPQIIVSMQTPPEYWPQKHERITHEAFAREVEAMVAAGRTVKPCRDAVCDILVERNTFVNPPGLLLSAENASRVTVRDNAVEWREPVFRRLPCAGRIRYSACGP